MTRELLDMTNENYRKRQGTEAHKSLLPKIQAGISQMYNIDDYNYVVNSKLLPNLEEYNVIYADEELMALNQLLQSKNMQETKNSVLSRG